MNEKQQENVHQRAKIQRLKKKEDDLSGEQRSHERKFFRLRTANLTIVISIVGIVFLAFASAIFGFYSTYSGCESLVDGENTRSAIFALSSIVTLALGFIAGSNIES